MTPEVELKLAIAPADAARLRRLAAARGGADYDGDHPAPMVASTSFGSTLATQLAHTRGITVDARCHPCDAERDGPVVPAGPADALIEATASWLAAQLLPSEP